MKIETKCIHSGYVPKNGEPRVAPISQSTTFKYDSTDEVAKLFDLQAGGFFYTRINNPTVDALEQKIAALEGGIGAVCFASGASATAMTVFTLCSAGDHILSSNALYGGTFNFLASTLKKFDIEVTFFNPDDDAEAIEKLIRPNTKMIFGETIANPSLVVLDIEKFAAVAKKHDIPFAVDNTFASPVNCRPFEFGADIVLHSTSKYLDGHAAALGGVVVDSGNYDWSNGKFQQFCQPDSSYHGVVFSDVFGKAAFVAKMRLQFMRDMGAVLSPNNAFITNMNIETLPLRMSKHCENALTIAKYLQQHDKIQKVNYPDLPGDKYYQLAQKYLPNGSSGVISFDIKGDRQQTAKFMDALKLFAIYVHVADVKSYVLHPASSTHRQMTSEQLDGIGISESMVRMSVGIENVEDLIEDIQQALNLI